MPRPAVPLPSTLGAACVGASLGTPAREFSTAGEPVLVQWVVEPEVSGIGASVLM